MFSDRVFTISLVLSFALHGVIMLQNPNFSPFENNRKEEKLEVSYVKKKEPQPKRLANKSEPFLKLDSRITMNKKLPPPLPEKNNIFKKDRTAIIPDIQFNKPSLTKPDIIAIKKRISITPTDVDMKNNVNYIAHCQIVREKIKRNLYQNYTGSETGEVEISFLISREGSLLDSRVIEEKSTPNKRLQRIAIESLKDAAPFPNFPKSLDYQQLSFNLTVSFEIE